MVFQTTNRNVYGIPTYCYYNTRGANNYNNMYNVYTLFCRRLQT